MSNIYCLLVGIDKYFHAQHNLQGCVNDVASICAYFRQSFPKHKLNIKILTNEIATKQNIIYSFSHFKEAKDGDFCIFYFSGHGSLCNAPEKLKDFVSDGEFKTMVCHDSRKPGNIDFMNLELAYLVWQITHNKKIQFVVITDCCHSGEATRTNIDNIPEIGVRRLDRGNQNFSSHQLSLQQELTSNAILSPEFEVKRGHHIHLAACRSDQKAIECVIRNNRRGIFSYFLIETLRAQNGWITYKDIHRKTKIKVERFSKSQTPQIYEFWEIANETKFMSYDFNTGMSLTQIYFNDNHEWVINSGTLNSSLGKNSSNNPKIKVSNSNKFLQIEEIFPTYSKLSEFEVEGWNESKIYDAQIIYTSLNKLPIGLSDFTWSQAQVLLEAYQSKKTLYSFFIEEKAVEEDVLVHLEDEDRYLIKDHQNAASNVRLSFYFSKEELSYMFNALEKITKWKSLLKLNNTNDLLNGAVQIHFYRHNSSNSGQNEPIDFEYGERKILTQNDPINNLPGIQLKFYNNSKKAIWISVLYLSDDYSITNELLNSVQLNPQKSAWVFQEDKSGKVLKTIRLKLSDELYESGQTSTIEYLKIFISSYEFNTDHFNQSGIKKGIKTRYRPSSWEKMKLQEWTSKTIPLQIVRH